MQLHVYQSSRQDGVRRIIQRYFFLFLDENICCDPSLGPSHRNGFEYRKNSKNWDTLNYHRDCPTNGIVGFYSAILRSKDADRITNRVDTDQTAPRGAV